MTKFRPLSQENQPSKTVMLSSDEVKWAPKTVTAVYAQKKLLLT